MNSGLRTILAVFSLGITLSGCGGSGKLQWTGVVEGESTTVASPLSERLTDLAVREGDSVAKGDILGHIDTTSQRLQRESLKEKEEQLSLQAVDIDNQIKVARKAESLARSTLKRYSSLKEQEGVSEQTLDELTLKADQAAATVSSLRLKKETLESQRKDLELQRQQLDDLIDRALLTAPGNGIVDKIYYNPGEYVPALRPVMDIVNLQELWCMIYVPEKLLPRLKTGMSLTIRAGDEVLTGRISHINAKAEFTPRELLTPDNRQGMAYGVKVSFANDRGAVKIGMPVDIFLDDENTGR